MKKKHLTTNQGVPITDNQNSKHSFADILPPLCRQTIWHPVAQVGAARYKIRLDARPDGALCYLMALDGMHDSNLRNRGSWVRIPLGAYLNHPVLPIFCLAVSYH